MKLQKLYSLKPVKPHLWNAQARRDLRRYEKTMHDKMSTEKIKELMDKVVTDAIIYGSADFNLLEILK